MAYQPLTYLILRRRVVGIHHGRRHLPFGLVGRLVDLFHVLAQLQNVHLNVVLEVIIFVQFELPFVIKLRKSER